jgi:antitoxin component YwqK of YwqJK toxin-antitoxin module
MVVAGLGSQLLLGSKTRPMNVTLRDGVAYDTVSGKLAMGMRELFHQNGLLHVRGKYAEGKQEGLWQIFYENGNLKESGHFVHGKQVGLWNFFQKDGKLKEQRDYEEGKLIARSLD